LRDACDGPFAVEAVETLAAGLERIRAGRVDAIIVDLALPDSQGLASLDRLLAEAPEKPILVLSALEDEALALEAVQRGAQGHLSKGYFDRFLVPQALRNIIQRKAIEEGLYLVQKRAQITLDSIGDCVIATDMRGNVDYLNAAAEHMLGWSSATAAGKPITVVLQLVNGRTLQAERNPIEVVLEEDKQHGLRDDTILILSNGKHVPIEDSASPIHDGRGRIAGAVMVFRDISPTVALRTQLSHQAQHDFLTNLPNRVLLNDRIVQALALAQRHGKHLSILFLDLDRFKHINDSLGHSVGDKLLRSVAERLLACIRASDTVSRQGGDEFVVLLAEDRHAGDAAVTAEKIVAALASPYMLDGHQVHISTSIGISVFPADGQDAETLIKNADTAIFSAKERGRNTFQFFRTEMNTRAVERQRIENALRLALERHEFVLYYQPKVDLDSARITGVEALLRWEHPDWGLTLPERFIAIAEECGLIVAIGHWVLREACGQAARWMQDGMAPFSLAINVSALEFRQPNFYRETAQVLAASRMDPRSLELELTETVLMRDTDASAALLLAFKTLGVRIAVDDFGTGYSSLAYLNQFPIDVLKIDRSFVHAIGTTASDNGVIVRAVVSMGKSLHQRVIAEGGEDEHQVRFLRDLHCDEAQGFWFSRPVPADQMYAMLRRGLCTETGRGAQPDRQR
jgi:diguanylate cyclase (GGDEF)-like protein/PAS domain S-box-containing protein